METKVVHYTELSEKQKQEIQEFCPWEGLKNNISNINTTDPWVLFTQKNYFSLLLDNQKIVWCGVFWKDEVFCKYFGDVLWLSTSDFMVSMYLCIAENFRGKNYSKLLKSTQKDFIKEQFPDIKYLVWSTSQKKLLEKYVSFWAQMIDKKVQNHAFLLQQWIENDYFFFYKL